MGGRIRTSLLHRPSWHPIRLSGNTTKGSLERLRTLRFKPRGTARFRRYELVSVCRNLAMEAPFQPPVSACLFWCLVFAVCIPVPVSAYILLGCGAYVGRILLIAHISARQALVEPKSDLIAQLDAAPSLPEVSVASDPSFYTSYRHVCRCFLLVWPSAPREHRRVRKTPSPSGGTVCRCSVTSSIRPVSAISTTSIRRHQRWGDSFVALGTFDNSTRQ